MADSIELMLDALNEGERFAPSKLGIDYTPIGRKYVITLRGIREDLDALAVAMTADAFPANTIPNLSAAIIAMVPANALVRTPHLDWDGEGKYANLIVPAEEGLNEGDSTVGTDPESDDQYVVPPNTTSRFVFEPNDVALAYGLPFRSGFKWDLEIDAPNVDFPVTYYLTDEHGQETQVDKTIKTLMQTVGLPADQMSLLAICNVWHEGSVTEQQRLAIYSYLKDDNGGGLGSQQYVRRILRGQDHYRFWIPHVTVIRRYRTMPHDRAAVPVPGGIFSVGDPGGPPIWTNAPDAFWDDPWQTEDFDASLYYSYFTTGPQLEFAGEFYIVEQQWSGFVDFDSDLYSDPLGTP